MFFLFFSWQSSFYIYCTWLHQQVCGETSKDKDTLRWRMPSTGKHLQLCFVNDLVLSFPRRHVVWMQFFIPVSTPVSSQRITLIEVKWEGACFSEEWMWSRRSKTTVLNKWGPTGPKPVITRSMNSEVNAFDRIHWDPEDAASYQKVYGALCSYYSRVAQE